MKKPFVYFVGLLILFIYSCNKDNTGTKIDDPEALSEDEIQILEDIDEATGFDSSTVILPNGENVYDYLMEVDPDFVDNWLKSSSVSDPYESLGPQDARNLLIARMSVVALNLTNRSKHQYPYAGENKPAQNGLAYSWGSKNHTIRQTPPGSGTACDYKIYGLDCSGFIYQVFKNVEVSIPSGPANTQRDPETIEEKIKNSNSSLDKIKVEDLGGISTTNFESGDIIYWTNTNNRATHIGLILKKEDGSLAVFQSNGSAGNNSSDCENNLSTRRGLRRLELSDPYWFGSSKSYGITRINAELSGNWSLYLRCAGQSVDAISFQLEFPTSSDNTFEVTGTGTDYDGAPFNCTINMTYNNSTNVLSGTSYITKPSTSGFYRFDSFSVKLNRDETEYFSWTLGENQDAGCQLEGRLVNNDNSTEKSAALEVRNFNNINSKGCSLQKR